MGGGGSWRTGFETVSDFRMFYRDWRPAGGESRPPVVALHGSLTQSAMWIAAAEGVAGARFICPDQRGYGLSEDPGGGDAAADFARDAVGLANVLRLDRFTVMGHSFACAIALEVARVDAGRVAAAVLVDPTVRDAGERRRNLEVSAERPGRFASLKEAARFFRESEEGEWPPAQLARFVRDVMVREGEGRSFRMPFAKERLLRLRAFQASSGSDYDPLAKAGSVECPVLIIRGGLSRRFSAEAERRLRGAFPNGARAVLCPRSGHFPTVSEGKLFQGELRKFLARAK